MTRLLLILLFVLMFAPTSLHAFADQVRVDQGLLSGAAGKAPGVRVFRGIPYAAPPVGELRWKAPQPPASWKGVREATAFGNACWQTPYPPAAAIYQAKLPSLSEDCLYLNIWSAGKSAKDKLPVMVWIHGGGFTRGSGTTEAYDGENLARKGVVVVTINYRLGIFGFFAHPALTAESAHHASGNYALLDQIAALEWVKKNIAAFGGDPGCVTIFGESAGSWAVNALMASPLAKGLFQRAIGESGGSFTPMRTLAAAEKSGEQLAASLGAGEDKDSDGKDGQNHGKNNDPLKVLRSRPAEELLKAAEDPVVRPIVDGWLLPQDVATIFAQGKQNDVPLIVGSNADEGTTLAPQGALVRSSMFISGAHQRYGNLADQFLKVYPAESDGESVASFFASYRDGVFGWEMRTWVRAATHTGHHPAYLYYFTRRPPGPQSRRLGAFHASEIPYVFGNFFWPFPWEEADHKLSETISSYWVNFARSGNPNGEGLPQWPAYSLKEDQAMELGDYVCPRSQVNKAGLDFFDSYYQSLTATAAGNATANTAK
ncbi:MAG TPA: carboxylesterase/lipase family protein [Candidatus Angelobacter sp.]